MNIYSLLIGLIGWTFCVVGITVSNGATFGVVGSQGIETFGTIISGCWGCLTSGTGGITWIILLPVISVPIKI